MSNEPPSIFGFGEAGLPAEVDILFRGAGANHIAQDLIDRCLEQVDHRLIKGERARRAASDRLAEVNTLAYALVAWHAKQGVPLPATALTALAYVLGLISPATGKPLPSATVAERLGLPPKIKKIEAFLEASLLDGEAKATGKVLRISELAKKVGVERATIRDWRKTPAYQRRTAIPGMAAGIFKKWNQPRRAPRPPR